VLDAAGNLLVANEFANSLTEYPITGNGDRGPIRTIIGLSLPDGVDVDAQGDIYVANSLGAVNEYAANASGAAAPIATISGPATGISGPSGVAVAPPLIVRTSKLRAARVGRTYRARLRANPPPPGSCAAGTGSRSACARSSSRPGLGALPRGEQVTFGIIRSGHTSCTGR
jgi:hypothetical protein